MHMPAGPQEEQQEQQEQHQGPKVRCRLPCCVPACERRLHAAAAWLGWSGRVWVADAVMAMSDVVSRSSLPLSRPSAPSAAARRCTSRRTRRTHHRGECSPLSCCVLCGGREGHTPAALISIASHGMHHMWMASGLPSCPVCSACVCQGMHDLSRTCWGWEGRSSVHPAIQASALCCTGLRLRRPVVCYAVALSMPMGKDDDIYQQMTVLEPPAPR